MPTGSTTGHDKDDRSPAAASASPDKTDGAGQGLVKSYALTVSVLCEAVPPPPQPQPQQQSV